MRDTPDAIRIAEKLITAQDIAEPEVVLDVEVLEVLRATDLNLGIAVAGGNQLHAASVDATIYNIRGPTRNPGHAQSARDRDTASAQHPGQPRASGCKNREKAKS